MKTANREFNNGFEGERLENALKYITNRENDVLRYYEDGELYENGNDELPPFSEYGLSFDYVEAQINDNGDVEDYFRFQFAWGGPSFEFRFYEDGEVYSVYMEWFKGLSQRAPKDVEDALFDEFDALEMLDFEAKRIESEDN